MRREDKDSDAHVSSGCMGVRCDAKHASRRPADPVRTSRDPSSSPPSVPSLFVALPLHGSTGRGSACAVFLCAVGPGACGCRSAARIRRQICCWEWSARLAPFLTSRVKSFLRSFLSSSGASPQASIACAWQHDSARGAALGPRASEVHSHCFPGETASCLLCSWFIIIKSRQKQAVHGAIGRPWVAAQSRAGG